MTPETALVAVLDALDAAAVPYMLVGSLASNVHGVPRSTLDADLVIDISGNRLADLAAALPAPLRLDVQSAFETVTGTTRHVVRLDGSPFVCELFHLSEDAHDQARFGRRISVPTLGRRPWIATAEDMVVTKLRWLRDAGRAKDREDVRGIIAVRGQDLDWAYIERWCERHDTRALLDEVRRDVPSS